MVAMIYLYLHGFASSPQSAKAKYLGNRFQEIGVPLITPDLNQNDFYNLTLTRQIQQVKRVLAHDPHRLGEPVTLIGSSLGGLTAAWIGEQYPLVQRLVLLAPAFEFLSHWLTKLEAEQVKQWEQQNSTLIFHHGEGEQRLLSYNFVLDAERYSESGLQRPIPTLILHGQQDEIIPICASQRFAQARSWVKLVELESDHSLGNVQAETWRWVKEFCQLNQVEIGNPT